MNDGKVFPSLAAPMWAAFRRHCHRFLSEGYQAALNRIRNEPEEETDITGYICEAIEDWFRKNPEEAACFYVKDDPPLGGAGRTGKRRPRTDIIIGYASGPRPEFFFEAKRLHRPKAGVSKYTGKNGMGCFIDGRYARKCTEVAMIGYVQTDLLEDWQGSLQANVKKNEVALALTDVNKHIDFPGSFPLEWASTHKRASLASIRIMHIVLDCRKSSHEESTPRLL